MVLAISFIGTAPGREKAVYHSLKQMDCVKNIYQLFGDHDLLVIWEAESREEIAKILGDVETMNFINSIKVMMGVSTDCHATKACNKAKRNHHINLIDMLERQIASA